MTGEDRFDSPLILERVDRGQRSLDFNHLDRHSKKEKLEDLDVFWFFEPGRPEERRLLAEIGAGSNESRWFGRRRYLVCRQEKAGGPPLKQPDLRTKRYGIGNAKGVHAK